MTRWRAAFLRARLIPLVISLAVVLVAEALQMGALLAWVVASVGIAVLRSRTMVGWRLFGVRKPTPDELEVLRAGISSAPTLRGRREPQLWTAPGDHVFMPTRGDLVISDSWTGYLAEGGDSETVAHLAASTAVRSDVTRRTWVVARDQPFWARRLRELGIASDPLDPRRPTPAAVREAAMQATAAPVRRGAEAVAAGISAEPDGADRPVTALERVRSRWDGRRGA